MALYTIKPHSELLRLFFYDDPRLQSSWLNPTVLYIRIIWSININNNQKSIRVYNLQAFCPLRLSYPLHNLDYSQTDLLMV